MYDADAHCKGYKDNKVALIQPKRMEWDLDKECRITIAEAVSANNKLCDDLDLRIMEHKAWGKGFIKKSPDPRRTETILKTRRLHEEA